jgi:hypothetical protein
MPETCSSPQNFKLAGKSLHIAYLIITLIIIVPVKWNTRMGTTYSQTLLTTNQNKNLRGLPTGNPVSDQSQVWNN